MTCDFDLKRLIEANARNILALRELGVVEGGTYTATQELVDALDQIYNETGVDMYVLEDNGARLKIRLFVSDETVKSYQHSEDARPGKTPREQSEDLFDVDHDEVLKAIQATYETNFSGLKRLLEDVMLSAQSKVSQLRKQGISDEMLANFSRIVADIKENPDVRAQVLAVARFVSEAGAVLSESAKVLPQFNAVIASTPESERFAVEEKIFVQMSNLMESVMIYESALRDMKEAVAGQYDNVFKKMVDKAISDLETVKSYYAVRAKSVALDNIDTSTAEKFERLKRNHEAEMAKLKEELDKAKTDRAKSRITAKMARLDAEFRKYSPSRERLEDHLVGNEQDSSLVSKFLLAGVDNPDLLVQGFTKMVKDKLAQAARNFREKSVKFTTAYQSLVETGKIDNTKAEDTFRELHVDVEISRYDPDTDTIVVDRVKYFDDAIDQKWRVPYSKFRARTAQLTFKIRQERQKEDHTELLRLENELSALNLEFTKWKRENIEGEFNEAYQEIQSILDETFTLDGRTATLAEMREQYFSVITDIQNRIDLFQGGVPSDEDLAEIQQQRNRYEAMRSTAGKVPGSVEYQIAQRLTEYHDRMNEATEAWVISPEAMQKFTRDKARIERRLREGSITQEEADRWFAANSTVVFDPRYWTARKKIVENLAQTANRIKELTGDASRVDLEDFYKNLESINKKYRDHNGIINGTQLTDEERFDTKKLDETIEDLKKEGRKAFGGFLGQWFDDEIKKVRADMDRHVAMIARVRQDDPTNSEFTKAQITILRGELTKLKKMEKDLVREALERKGLSTDQMALFNSLYSEYESNLRELGKLTDSFNSQYYYDEYAKQRKIFIDSITEEEVASALNSRAIFNGKRYGLDPKDGLYKPVMFNGKFGKDNPLTYQMIKDELFDEDFKSSDWYRANHYEAIVWDPKERQFSTKMVPIYSWKVTRPANKNFIQSEAPNQSWKKRKVKDSYRNPNGGLDLDGRPKPKKEVWRNPAYEAKRAAKPELWAFRDTMIAEYLAAQEYFDQGDRMGMRVPSIVKDLNLTSIGETGLAKRSLDDIKRKWVRTEQDRDEGLSQSDESGYEKRVVPIMLRGRLEAELVSDNILETVGKYVGQAEVYKARRELARSSRAVEDTLAHSRHTPSTSVSSKMAKFLGFNRFLKKRGENQRLDTIRFLTKMMVYGESVFHETERGQLWYKRLSNLLGLRAMSIFSFSGLSQAVNLAGGLTQQLIKTGISGGDARFGFSDLLWAEKEFVFNSTAFVRDIGRVSGKSFWTQFAEVFDVNDLDLVDNFGEEIRRAGLVKNIRADMMSAAKTAVEHELFMTTLMAFSRAHLVDSPSGKIPLKDAFEMKSGVLRLKEGVELSQAQMNDIKGYINALMKDINGNYNKLDKTVAEGFWFGKAMLFLRKWIINQTIHRWGGKQFSIEQDRIIQGYYITTGAFYKDAFSQGNRDAILSLFWTSLDKTMTDRERDAINRTKTELGLLLLLSLTIRYVLGYDDDDEDRFKKLEKSSDLYAATTYVAVKALSEQSIFLPGINAREAQVLKNNLFSNVFPYADQVIDIVRKDFDFGAILDPDDPFLVEYKVKTGIHKRGDTRLAADFWKLLGRTNAKVSAVEALKTFEQNLNK